MTEVEIEVLIDFLKQFDENTIRQHLGLGSNGYFIDSDVIHALENWYYAENKIHQDTREGNEISRTSKERR